LVLFAGVDTQARAQDDDAEATIEALSTRVADLEDEVEELSATATAAARPTRVAPSPTPDSDITIEEAIADYPVIEDIRELAIRPGSLVGERIAFSGTVLTIKVAAPGQAFTLGDAEPRRYVSFLQINVPTLDGTTETVFVGYDGDTAGVFEGSYVSVYATVVGTETFDNALGGAISQPLVAAALVTLV